MVKASGGVRQAPDTLIYVSRQRQTHRCLHQSLRTLMVGPLRVLSNEFFPVRKVCLTQSPTIADVDTNIELVLFSCGCSDRIPEFLEYKLIKFEC